MAGGLDWTLADDEVQAIEQILAPRAQTEPAVKPS
jgi:hypothetical protein